MTQEFERYIKNKDDFSPTEKKARRESLKSFIEMGFPNKKLEDWKFTDFNQIISKNFKKLKINESIKKTNKVNLVKDFEHNYILLVNGFLNSYSFEFENSKKVKIQKYSQNLKKEIIAKNSLVKLNDALHDGGYFLEVSSDYKFKKPIIIY